MLHLLAGLVALTSWHSYNLFVASFFSRRHVSDGRVGTNAVSLAMCTYLSAQPTRIVAFCSNGSVLTLGFAGPVPCALTSRFLGNGQANFGSRSLCDLDCTAGFG